MSPLARLLWLIRQPLDALNRKLGPKETERGTEDE